MRHLDDEDIAGLIDGTINKKDRETFLKHLSGCKDCLTVYSETLKFIEDEKAEKVPFGERLKMTVKNAWESMGGLFPVRIFNPVNIVAMLIVLVIGGYLVFGPPDNGPHDSRVQFIAAGLTEMSELYTFSTDNDKKNAAVRAGFLTEDLAILKTSGGNEELKHNINKQLQAELKTLFGSTIFPPAELDIERRLKEQSLFDLYSLGRFIERSALATFENKRPGQEEMDTYLKIAQAQNLPPGFFKRFRNVSTVESWKEIKEIFLVVK